MIIVRSPLRISIGGGATDLPVYYENNNGTVFSSLAINKYIYISITKRFQELWNDKFPNWQQNDKMQSIWLELVKSMNESPSEADIERTLKKIKSECALSENNMKEIMQINNNNMID